ncbi:recombinase family protein [Limnohabitans sp. DM1]|uniref:recombinase family protein n=1 Tax=Limnohabitans sp. DM1 TaxID=1597955 RepID=UPI000B7D0FC3
MPQVFAYLRVSTDAQDVANQKHCVVRYCVDKRLLEPVFIEDTASGKTDWRARPLGKLIERAGQGDVVVVSEVSRLARSTLQVLEIGSECIEPGIRPPQAAFLVWKGNCSSSTSYVKSSGTWMGFCAESFAL